MGGMLYDGSIQKMLTENELNELKRAKPYDVSFKVEPGREANVVNGMKPDFLSMHVSLWRKDESGICGSRAEISPLDEPFRIGDGFDIRFINGTIDTVASG